MADDRSWQEDEDLVQAEVWDPALLRRLLKYARPYVGRVLSGLFLTTISSAFAVTPPLLIGALLDVVFTFENGLPGRVVARVLGAMVPGLSKASFTALEPMSKLWIFAGIFLFVRLASFFIDWANSYLLAGLGQRVMYDIRVGIFRHTHSLDLAWFHKHPVGRLVTRTTNDVGALEEMFSVALVTIVKDVGMLLGITTILLVLDLKLGLIVLSVIPLLTVATVIFRRASRAAYRRWRAALSRLNAFLAENIGGIRVVKLFHKERANDESYDRIGREYRDHFLSQRKAWAIYRPVNTTLSAMGTGLIYCFGGGAVLLRTITVGEFYAYLAYVDLFYAPIRDLTEKFDIIQGALTAAERIFGILDEESRIVDAPDAVDPGRVKGAVEFRDVAFEYLPGEPVIKGLSLTVAPGETVAVVGHTGAGKTTLVNLLCRLYDVKSGAVLVDGRDVRKLKVKRLRENIAVVHQDVFLFAGTILDNLRLSDDSIPLERVHDACRQVAADRFIESLPGGYEAVVEEAGKTFSTGERQLLSFARALVFDPAILVLDEATSSVDSKTEERIQGAIDRLTADRTSIVIAHRLSTIQKADRILVLDDGRLAEAGTHRELLARGGLYHRLYKLQFEEE
jgi:ATP-binding cassette, subfamily B, multidrug efflux pump